MQRMWAMCEIKMNTMLALHYESSQRMLDRVPPELLQIPLGEFLSRSGPGGDLEEVGDMRFELADQFKLLG